MKENTNHPVWKLFPEFKNVDFWIKHGDYSKQDKKHRLCQ